MATKRTNTAVWNEKEKRWRINVQQDGQRRTFYSATPGRAGQREANAKADAWLDNRVVPSNATVKALYPEYEEQQRLISDKSYVDAYMHGKNYIIPAKGRIKIEKLTEQDCQDIINAAAYQSQSNKQAQKKDPSVERKGLSQKSLRNLRYDITNFVKFCRKKGLTGLILEDLAIPKNAPKSQKTILQPDCVVKLLKTDLTMYRGKVMVDPLVRAYRAELLIGFRPGELMGLERKDVAPDCSYIDVSRSINAKGKTTTGKNENTIRRVYLTEWAQREIKAQLAEYTGAKVFPIRSQEAYRTAWYRYAKYNSIPAITPYEMRHTFVSLSKRLPDGILKGMVGHSKNMDTFGVYGHEVTGEGVQGARDLQAVFEDILGDKL